MRPAIPAILGLAATLLGHVQAADNPPGEFVSPRSADPAVGPKPGSGVAPGAITFAHPIARIIHQRCAGCHHEGQGAPFNLLTYEDVRKRARQILEQVEHRAMPPWLAEPGYGAFSNDRRLPDDELALIRRWVNDGAPEGDPQATPAPPHWPAGWLEGPPDLVVTMPAPYALGPEGPDVYRNFVVPLPLDRDRWVRAVQFAPGNARIVHHAFIRVDEEGQGRRREGRDGAPGFAEPLASARMPGGQFLTWNPGSRPIVAPPGLAWKLARQSDLVVEMHLNRTGKPETLQFSVGFYFTNEAPTNTCYTFKLGSLALDFPAGATRERVKDTFVLPVGADVLAVYPHAHFLGREMQAYAVRPDGIREWLVLIKQWDFNWQGDYRYVHPVRLPAGTTLHLEYSYDNSTNNPVNPFSPPRRVVYGERSSDEMCELGVQVLTHRTNDLKILQDAVLRHRGRQIEDQLRQRLSVNREDAEALTRYGMILWSSQRRQEAWSHLERAVQVRPELAEAHYNQGVYHRFSGQLVEARRSFETTLRLDPRYPRAHQQLGFALAALGEFASAERSFEQALALEPSDATARDGLAELRRILKSRPGAK